MAKLIYSMNISLDGYMEDEKGNFDWSVPDEDVFAFWTDFQESIGTDIYGRRMYETMVYWETVDDQSVNDFENNHELEAMLEFADIWRKTEKIVFSKSLQTVSSAKTRIERELTASLIQSLKENAEKDLTVSGPNLAFQVMEMGLVDECYLMIYPIILGGGKRALPDNLRLQLELINTQNFSSGTVLLHYRILK